MPEQIAEPISEFLRERIAAGDFPSAVYLAAEKGEIVFQDALGFAVVEPERIAARIDTIYDLASLTKPLVTGLLCARLIDNGVINLSDKISAYFDFFESDQGQQITIENLLTHTSGLRAWKPLYLSKSLWSGISEENIEYPANSKVVYSDLNFILLEFIIEEAYGDSLGDIAEKVITEALNLESTFYNPPPELQKRIAASEKGNEYEKQMCAGLGYDVSKYDWRDYQIWGEVHDGNCWFMDGVSGHAGLFSNIYDAFQIAQQFLANQTKLLKPETCALFRTNFTENLNEARSVAFQLAETKNSAAGDSLPKNSFGHLGFTGTSLWIDPGKERIFILLTNRTHARPLPFADINGVRRRFHQLAAQTLDER